MCDYCEKKGAGFEGFCEAVDGKSESKPVGMEVMLERLPEKITIL